MQIPEAQPDDWNVEEKGEFAPNPEKSVHKEMKVIHLNPEP